MDIKTLVNITSRAWALPILASLHEGVAGRQAPLLGATGASRTAFSQSMDHLIAMGLVERNPGHGHPLRPEFRLTAGGQAAAAFASKIRTLPDERDVDLLRRSWTLPVLTTLQTPKHFSDIKRRLPTISDRALSQSLKTMEARDWVCRRVDASARPPRSLYRSVNAGGVISAVAARDVMLGP